MTMSNFPDIAICQFTGVTTKTEGKLGSRRTPNSLRLKFRSQSAPQRAVLIGHLQWQVLELKSP